MLGTGQFSPEESDTCAALLDTRISSGWAR
jgi:hypothetical protein